VAPDVSTSAVRALTPTPRIVLAYWLGRVIGWVAAGVADGMFVMVARTRMIAGIIGIR
jgi:hypothetical protein